MVKESKSTPRPRPKPKLARQVSIFSGCNLITHPTAIRYSALKPYKSGLPVAGWFLITAGEKDKLPSEKLSIQIFYGDSTVLLEKVYIIDTTKIDPIETPTGPATVEYSIRFLAEEMTEFPNPSKDFKNVIDEGWTRKIDKDRRIKFVCKRIERKKEDSSQ